MNYFDSMAEERKILNYKPVQQLFVEVNYFSVYFISEIPSGDLPNINALKLDLICEWEKLS